MKRWLRALAACAAVALGLAAYAGFRWSRLAGTGARLVAVANGFPKEYDLQPSSRGTLVALGDSTALGVGVARLEDTMAYRLASRLKMRHVLNLGVSGARMADVLQDGSKAPEGALILLSVTANDATHGSEPDAVERELRRVLTALEARKPARVVVTTTPNFLTTPALPFPLRSVVAGRASALAKVVRRVAGRFPLVRVADLHREGTLAADEYAEDGFHPNAKGYRAWERIVLAALR